MRTTRSLGRSSLRSGSSPLCLLWPQGGCVRPGPVLVIASALVVSTYCMDVLGFVPGAVIAACGIEAFLRDGFGNRARSDGM